ncbi:sarcoplasmic calcium-binding protein [Mizuhopecten yessoensis]|uniref:Sarcoplasmic calcium-binding protein n=1 Tax=Mizuhopecten yessoensis TaxID=6573 RepID=Q9TVJ4_MIZYE|nr:sarcoplasmic calcium-binding protein [Mizuhopecten yessoensis]OWF50458.1 Sarcoplasmic calcium-binding protein [Mizuhopecten yessoensis]BAA89417.1 sarcoplasmic calcium-binding protein [Mizuhopecten yessoensis]BAA89419.1 sarcoplasmic calcium-binding protein [Mizuhopecten yessoensis]
MTDYLVSKWKIWYKSLDVNHDGIISIEDVEESRNKFTDLHKLVGDKSTGVKVDMQKWWDTYIFLTPGAEISETQFVENLGNSFKKDKKAFLATMTACFNMIFDVIDTNKDRSIDLNEFIYAFAAFGHENESVVRTAFALLKPDDNNTVPLRTVVDAWISFVTCEDASKTDVIKSAFES